MNTKQGLRFAFTFMNLSWLLGVLFSVSVSVSAGNAQHRMVSATNKSSPPPPSQLCSTTLQRLEMARKTKMKSWTLDRNPEEIHNLARLWKATLRRVCALSSDHQDEMVRFEDLLDMQSLAVQVHFHWIHAKRHQNQADYLHASINDHSSDDENQTLPSNSHKDRYQDQDEKELQEHRDEAFKHWLAFQQICFEVNRRQNEFQLAEEPGLSWWRSRPCHYSSQR